MSTTPTSSLLTSSESTSLLLLPEAPAGNSPATDERIQESSLSTFGYAASLLSMAYQEASAFYSSSALPWQEELVFSFFTSLRPALQTLSLLPSSNSLSKIASKIIEQLVIHSKEPITPSIEIEELREWVQISSPPQEPQPLYPLYAELLNALNQPSIPSECKSLFLTFCYSFYTDGVLLGFGANLLRKIVCSSSQDAHQLTVSSMNEDPLASWPIVKMNLALLTPDQNYLPPKSPQLFKRSTGSSGIGGFNALSGDNLPYMLYTIEMNPGIVKRLRFPSPTIDDGLIWSSSAVTEPFIAFLEAVQAKGEKLVYTNLQDAQGRVEGRRWEQLNALSARFPETFYFLSFSHDNSWFKQTDEFSPDILLSQFIEKAAVQMTKEGEGYQLPSPLAKEHLPDLINDAADFLQLSKEEPLLINQRKNLIFLTHQLIKLQLYSLLLAGTPNKRILANDTCRDSRDRGAIENCALFLVCSGMSGQWGSPETKILLHTMLFLSAWIDAKQSVVKERLDRFLLLYNALTTESFERISQKKEKHAVRLLAFDSIKTIEEALA